MKLNYRTGLDPEALRRKLSTGLRVFREEGVAALTNLLRQRIDLQVKLFAARGIESVTLDGCTFSLRHIPNTPMKLVLLDGEYESFERRAVLQYVDPEQPVIELGGCIGVVACITNRMLNDARSHVVLEANPEVIPLLEESRRSNRCQFEIVNAAITYGKSSATFSPSRDLWSNSLLPDSRGATVTVPATRLRDIVDGKNFNSFTLICDIEGFEYELILNEAEVLQRAQTIILETHARVIGEAKTAQLLDKLKEIGFRMVDQESIVVVMKRFPA
jgi:FkbM family methyltransferase